MLKFKTGDMVCVTPIDKMLVWEYSDRWSNVEYFELKAHHKYYGIYLSSNFHENRHYIVLYNKCYIFWRYDFDFKSIITAEA